MSGVRAVNGLRGGGVRDTRRFRAPRGQERGERLVLDGRADHCCVLTLERATVAVLADAVVEIL